MTVYIPFLNTTFKPQPLSMAELVMVLLLSCTVFIAVEIEKLIKRIQKQLDNKQQAYQNSSKFHNNSMLEVLRTR